MAYTARTPEQASQIAKQRKQVGRWLKKKREEAGLSQRDVAQKIGFENYTFISQIEVGRGRLPSEHYEKYSEALGVPARVFAIKMLQYYEAQLYSMIMEKENTPSEESLSDIERRLQLLEEKLSAEISGS